MHDERNPSGPEFISTVRCCEGAASRCAAILAVYSRRFHVQTAVRTPFTIMRSLVLALVLAPIALSAQPRAKNVILFLADAGGTSTIAAASLHEYGEPRRLFVQRMPHIGLSDTTTASQLVADSAAGMTAIVTGQRTHNGVVGQSASAVRRKVDGEPLKTILEYAEERGLSTGLITDDAITGATPASLYAKANDRALT